MKKMPVSQLILKVFSAAMTVLFIFWTYYQFNDADSLRWVVVYGVAGIMSLLFILNRLTTTLPLVPPAPAWRNSVALTWFAFVKLPAVLVRLSDQDPGR